jgi:hypothetical protein
VQAQLLASLDPEVFSSLRGDRLPKRTKKPPPRHFAKSVAKIYVANTQSPQTSKPQTEKFSTETLAKNVGKSIDVIQVSPAPSQELRNASIDKEEIIGVGTVELIRPKISEVKTTDHPIVSPSSDTDSKPNFSGKISSKQKSSSAFRADQELLELTPSVDDISGDGGFTLPTFVKQFLSSKEFDPQLLLERLRSNVKFDLNATWLSDYKILSCSAQPFLHRLSIMGEFFEVAT